MRQYIDTVRRLFEADILPFTPRSEPIHRESPAGEVVPFPTSEPEPQRFHLIVYAATPQPGGKPKLRMVDDLDKLNAEEVATQLQNYHPAKQKANLWISAPIKSSDETTYYYAQVLVGASPPRQHDMEEIDRHMAG